MTAATPLPLYFGPSQRPLFGWLHAHERTTVPLGIVICNPFGYEAVCAHRTLRHLAARLSALGVPTLRFDYDGTGNSAGDDFEPQRVAAWLASIDHACDELKARLGVSALCLVGVRLGASLAISVAQRRNDVAGLVAIAPALNSKLYLRELRAFEAAIRGAAPLADGWLESAGYVMTADTLDDLAQLNPGAPASMASHILVLDREDFPAGQEWSQALGATVPDVVYKVAADYPRMAMSPIERELPEASIAEVVSWLRRWLPAAGLATSGTAPIRSTMRLSVIATGASIDETAILLDAAVPMFGILTQRAAPRDAKRRAILLLNAGATHHIGFSRLYVTLARRWAADGDVVLRLDIRGIGDSPAPAGSQENDVYPASATADIAQACRFLRTQCGVSEVVGMGLCAGAYHALKAAGAGVPLDAIVMINPLTFQWRPGSVLSEEFGAERVARDAARYKKNLLRAESWKKLLSGKVNLVSVGVVTIRRAVDKARAVGRDLARMLRIRVADDLAAELADIAQRGTGVHFIFASSDPGVALLNDQGGAAVRRLERLGAVTRTLIADANHTFTSLSAREALMSELQALLDARAQHLAGDRKHE